MQPAVSTLQYVAWPLNVVWPPANCWIRQCYSSDAEVGCSWRGCEGVLRDRKILIFGRTGQLGWELRHKMACLGQVSAVGLPEVDFVRPDSIRAAIRAYEPAVIVNAAAYTAVDKAESEPALARSINATGPAVLAEEAMRSGALLIHYSTDYVFDGTKRGAWLESDEANPLGVYGSTKLEGDQAIETSGCYSRFFARAGFMEHAEELFVDHVEVRKRAP